MRKRGTCAKRGRKNNTGALVFLNKLDIVFSQRIRIITIITSWNGEKLSSHPMTQRGVRNASQ